MRDSVFSVIGKYFVSIGVGSRTTVRALKTAIPYLFGVGENHREVTEQYPDPISSKTEGDLPPKTRGLLYNDASRCTGCGDCVAACPAACIELKCEPGPDPSKKWISVFNVDFGKCAFCGICADVCGPGSLVHTKQYEGAAFRSEELVACFGKGEVTLEQRERWKKMRQTEEMDF